MRYGHISPWRDINTGEMEQNIILFLICKVIIAYFNNIAVVALKPTYRLKVCPYFK